MNKTNNKIVIHIIKTSMIALLIGHLMQTTNILFFVVGLVICSLYVFYNTLQKNDIFSFVMVMFFCNFFPYQLSRGGAFNYVSVINIVLYLGLSTKSIFEIKQMNKKFYFLIAAWVISSILGWLFNFVGMPIDLFLSIFSFTGVIVLLLLAGHIYLNQERIIVFLKLNFFLIIYSTIASINTYLKIIPLSPMMPRYGERLQGFKSYFEAGGIIGSSPFYGQHSLLLAILFITFYFIGYSTNHNAFSRKYLFIGALISIINVFMSISKAVLFSLIIGFVLYIFNQRKIIKIQLSKQVSQFLLLIFIVFITLLLVKVAGIDYVFDRIEEQTERNRSSGKLISVESFIDGSAFNRGTAFFEGKKKYQSKNSWLVGYGWGLTVNNRHAFYVDIGIRRGSAHSQYLAIFFLFGWLGTIAFWSLHLYSIWRSFSYSGYRKYPTANRIFALASLGMLIMLMLTGLTADNISYSGYFTSTMIILGLSYANLNMRRNEIESTGDINVQK